MPGEVLTRLNRYQLEHGEDELFTVLYAIVDPSDASVTWASAGHLPPLLRCADGETDYVEGGDGLMGLDDVTYTRHPPPAGPGRDADPLHRRRRRAPRRVARRRTSERLARAASLGPRRPAGALRAHPRAAAARGGVTRRRDGRRRQGVASLELRPGVGPRRSPSQSTNGRCFSTPVTTNARIARRGGLQQLQLASRRFATDDRSRSGTSALRSR